MVKPEFELRAEEANPAESFNFFMKNSVLIRLLTLTITAVGLLVVSGRGQSILTDDFDGANFSTNWSSAAPFSDSRMYLGNSAANFENRGRLLTTFNLPTSYIVEGSFKLLGSSYDQFAIFLRTDGEVAPPGSFYRGVGVLFQVRTGDQGATGINNVKLFDSVLGEVRTDFPISVGISYSFKIINTATNVSLYLANAAYPTLTMATTNRFGNLIGIQNREGSAGGSGISANSVTALDYIYVTNTDTTLPNICTPHKATATPVLVNGFVVGATITDSGCGYTNAPLVLIQGGGGAGSTATATVNNGQVTGINITSAGSGYSTTPAPKIVIASPPFEPSVGIAVSRVNVTQHVTLGRNYVLESSADLATWSATGQAFTAVSENYTNEFVVGQTGQFFRLREVP